MQVGHLLHLCITAVSTCYMILLQEWVIVSLVLQAFSKAYPKQQSAIRYFFPLHQHNRWISMPNIILCDVLNYTTNSLCNRGTMHTAKTNYSATVNGDFVVKSLPIACIIVGSANVEYGQWIYSVLHGRKTQRCCYKENINWQQTHYYFLTLGSNT